MKTLAHRFVENVNSFYLKATDYFIVKPFHLICKLLFYYKENLSIVLNKFEYLD